MGCGISRVTVTSCGHQGTPGQQLSNLGSRQAVGRESPGCIGSWSKLFLPASLQTAKPGTSRARSGVCLGEARALGIATPFFALRPGLQGQAGSPSPGATGLGQHPGQRTAPPAPPRPSRRTQLGRDLSGPSSHRPALQQLPPPPPPSSRARGLTPLLGPAAAAAPRERRACALVACWLAPTAPAH